jgi:Methyltransferase domain
LNRFKNFAETTAFIHRDKFNQPMARNWVDSYLLFEIVSLLQPRSVLEIGYDEGFSFSLMYDAVHGQGQFVSCDVDYSRDELQKLTKLSNCEFINKPSKELTLNQKFDFLSIDGDHSYDPVMFELDMCARALEDTGLLMVDDYTNPEVGRALDEFLPNSGLLLVIQGHQQIFLSKKPLANEFKNNLISGTKLFVSWTEKDPALIYQSKTVLLDRSFPNIIQSVVQAEQ